MKIVKNLTQYENLPPNVFFYCFLPLLLIASFFITFFLCYLRFLPLLFTHGKKLENKSQHKSKVWAYANPCMYWNFLNSNAGLELSRKTYGEYEAYSRNNKAWTWGFQYKYFIGLLKFFNKVIQSLLWNWKNATGKIKNWPNWKNQETGKMQGTFLKFNNKNWPDRNFYKILFTTTNHIKFNNKNHEHSNPKQQKSQQRSIHSNRPQQKSTNDSN